MTAFLNLVPLPDVLTAPDGSHNPKHLESTRLREAELQGRNYLLHFIGDGR